MSKYNGKGDNYFTHAEAQFCAAYIIITLEVYHESFTLYTNKISNRVKISRNCRIK